jgi:hypothetical protein
MRAAIIVIGGAAAALAVLGKSMLPELRRYMKIRSL